MTSLFLYQIDYNLKVNEKYGVQTLLKRSILCLQSSFRFVLALAERLQKKNYTSLPVHHQYGDTRKAC